MTDHTAPGAANGVYPLRRILILIAAFAAPIIGYGQMALGWGLSPSEFSAQGDSTLRVAGYAFAIWGVIYAWLIVYAVYQALPSTTESDMSARLGWPSLAALALTGIWVIASALNIEWATVAIIVAAALSLLVPIVRNGPRFRAEPLHRKALVLWPLALLMGWLTIASLVNTLTVATSQGLITPEAADLWALAAVLVATAMALLVTYRTRIWTYPVPIAWGLIGAFFAQRTEGNNLLAFSALGAATLIIIGATLILSRRDDQAPGERRSFSSGPSDPTSNAPSSP
jgi:hypothetical protein